MQLQTKSFSGLLQDMAASTQGAAGNLLDFTTGSVLRAVFEGVAGVFLWLQYNALQILSITRAATSTGGDLDSWMADFNFTRLAAAPATGSLCFGRYTAGAAVTIPIGTIAKSSDGSQSFSVVADPANPAWNPAGYFTLGTGISEVTVAANAVVAGTAGNVAADTVTLLASAVSGIDTVTNAAAFSGGIDAESDVAFRNRFVLFINSRSLATRIAILSAIQSVQQGLQVAIAENTNAAGAVTPGTFLVVVGASGGVLTTALMGAVATAIESVRPVGSSYSIMAPIILPVNISFNLVMATGTSSSTVLPLAVASLVNWISSLPIGGVVSVSRLEALIHGCSSSILSVQDMRVNGGADDIQAQWNELFTAATITGG